MTDEAATTGRIDKWLWHARFFKTRVLATAATHGGHVRVNDERVRPGHRIRQGDVITLVRDQLPYSMTVQSIPSRRGPAPEARACYEESKVSVREREAIANSIRRDRLQMPRTAGKPDKHTRRRLRERNRTSKTD